MRQRWKKIVLLPVCFLAVVFILGGFRADIFATEKMSERKEKGGRIDSFFVLQKGETIEIEVRIEGFQKEKNVEFRLYQSEKKMDFPKKEILKEKRKGKKGLKFSVSTEVESSGYYYFKLVAKQGKKRAEKRLELPVYLRGKENSGTEIKPSAKFVNDVLVMDWKGEEGGTYRIGVYDSKTLERISEKTTKETTLSIPLSKEHKKVSVGVALLGKRGAKNHFSLIKVGNREEPNIMVKLPESEILRKNEVPIDIIFTGNCMIEIFLNDKKEVKKIEESGEYRVELPKGESLLRVVAHSENGNERTFEKKFLVDTRKPKISLDTALDGAVTGDDFIHIAGEVDEEVRLKLNESPLLLNEEGRFQTNFPLKEGENELKLIAEDKAGNTNVVRAIVKKETAHEPDKRIAVLVFGTFGIIFLAYLVTFTKWVLIRRKRKP